MHRLATVICATLIATTAHAQWTEQHSTTGASLRGLSVVDSAVAWASGSGGTYLWTENGGAEWHSATVPEADALDFRDVHAVSRDTAYLMAAGPKLGRIYKTTDRGAHWTLQYNDTRDSVFLDAMAFFDAQHGVVIGDPMGGHFLILTTGDGGAHWTQISPASLPATLPGEAAFAASGTALVTCGPRDAWFATGGGRAARVFRTRDGGATWTVSETPVAAGSGSSGIFSLAFVDATHGVAVGGDYAKPDTMAVTVASTQDGGATWTAVPPSGATGYLSGVTYLPGSGVAAGAKPSAGSLVAVGTQGTAYSRDGGQRWIRLSSMSLNVVAVDSKTGRVWGAGDQGVIAVSDSSTLGASAR